MEHFRRYKELNCSSQSKSLYFLAATKSSIDRHNPTLYTFLVTAKYRYAVVTFLPHLYYTCSFIYIVGLFLALKMHEISAAER